MAFPPLIRVLSVYPPKSPIAHHTNIATQYITISTHYSKSVPHFVTISQASRSRPTSPTRSPPAMGVLNPVVNVSQESDKPQCTCRRHTFDQISNTGS